MIGITARTWDVHVALIEVEHDDHVGGEAEAPLEARPLRLQLIPPHLRPGRGRALLVQGVNVHPCRPGDAPPGVVWVGCVFLPAHSEKVLVVLVVEEGGPASESPVGALPPLPRVNPEPLKAAVALPRPPDRVHAHDRRHVVLGEVAGGAAGATSQHAVELSKVDGGCDADGRPPAPRVGEDGLGPGVGGHRGRHTRLAGAQGGVLPARSSPPVEDPGGPDGRCEGGLHTLLHDREAGGGGQDVGSLGSHAGAGGGGGEIHGGFGDDDGAVTAAHVVGADVARVVVEDAEPKLEALVLGVL
mmetsp:Transcript_42380/g.135754  ORF Transcript_42380/g.135754 Transcript_42380/m.135754 type:complete len:301 (+) Transcript_42380:592-1494(+)